MYNLINTIVWSEEEEEMKKENVSFVDGKVCFIDHIVAEFKFINLLA